MKFAFRHHEHHVGIGGVVVPSDHPSALLVIDAHGRSPHGAAVRGGADFRCSEPHGEYSAYALDASLHRGEHVHPLSHGAEARPVALAGSVSLAPEYVSRSSAASRHFDSHVSPSVPCDFGAESPSGLGGDGRPELRGSASPTSAAIKRALHLEDHESECPVANPDPASRPRSRQFFRLGRDKFKPIDRAAGRAGCPISSDSSDDELSLSERSKRIRKNSGIGRATRGIAGLRKPMLRRAQSLPIGASPAARAANETAARKSSSTPPIEATGSADDAVDPKTSSNAAHPDRLIQSERIPHGHRTHRRHVTFACVQIREYSTILGDHPCCPSGPPLSLGWTLERELSADLDEFERERLPRRARRREEIKLSGDVRRDILSGLVIEPTTSPSSGDDEGSGEGEEECEGEVKAVYSEKDIRRAERRLMRERAGRNSRQHRKMNNRFFRPLTEEEMGAAPSGGGVVVATNPCEQAEEADAGEEEATGMDISPIKRPPNATSFGMEDKDDEERPSC